MPKYVITAGHLESAYILKSYGVPLTVIAKVLGINPNTISWHLRRHSKTSPFADLREIVRTLRETADRVQEVADGKVRIGEWGPGVLQMSEPTPRTTLLPDIIPGAPLQGPPARFQSDKAGEVGADQPDLFFPPQAC